MTNIVAKRKKIVGILYKHPKALNFRLLSRLISIVLQQPQRQQVSCNKSPLSLLWSWRSRLERYWNLTQALP